MLALLLGLGAVGWRPAEAQARQSMSFSPGDRARPATVRARRPVAAAPGHGRAGRRGPQRTRSAPPDAVRSAKRPTGGDDEGSAAQAAPGKGFTLDNGVLTYPAPARFQPQNLRHH